MKMNKGESVKRAIRCVIIVMLLASFFVLVNSVPVHAEEETNSEVGEPEDNADSSPIFVQEDDEALQDDEVEVEVEDDTETVEDSEIGMENESEPIENTSSDDAKEDGVNLTEDTAESVDEIDEPAELEESEELEEAAPMMLMSAPKSVPETAPKQMLTIYENDGKLFVRDEATGENLKGQWVTIDDNLYYASDYEFLWQNRTINMAGKNYYVDETGNVVKGKVVYDENRDKYYYSDPETGAYVKGQWVNIGKKTYYASDYEYLWQNRTINMTGKNYYVGADCSVTKGKVVYDKTRDRYYYGDSDTGAYVKGQWVEYKNNTYYASDYEYLWRNGSINMAGKNYYVDNKCRVVKNQIVYDKSKDKYYYSGEDGAYVKGQWVDVDDKTYYASDYEYLHRNRFINQAGSDYYVGDDCSIVKGKQTIDGTEYYFDDETGALYAEGWYYVGDKLCYFKDKNYVMGPNLIDGRQYYFDKSGALKSRTGIDVSSFQGEIDWQKVKNDGIEFAFIRVGGRYSSRGTIYDDKYALDNLRGAQEAGLDIGVYFFSQAITIEEALEEAEKTLEVIQGFELTMPVVFDTEHFENDARHYTEITREERTEIVIAFCERIREAGYTPMYYAGKYWCRDHLNVEDLDDKYEHWIAQYYKECTYDGPYRCWQYSDSGKVAGINGDVDMNIWYLDKLGTYETPSSSQSSSSSSSSSSSVGDGRTVVSVTDYPNCNGDGHGYKEILYSDGTIEYENY